MLGFLRPSNLGLFGSVHPKSQRSREFGMDGNSRGRAAVCIVQTVAPLPQVFFSFRFPDDAMQPYAVRVTDGVAANLLEVIALPDGQLQ